MNNDPHALYREALAWDIRCDLSYMDEQDCLYETQPAVKIVLMSLKWIPPMKRHFDILTQMELNHANLMETFKAAQAAIYEIKMRYEVKQYPWKFAPR